MKKLKVVVVDDQQEVRMMFRDMLINMGIDDIYDTDNGESALSCYETMVEMTGPVDIIFCDWNMPGLSGVEVLREIRSVDPHVPVVMVTGRGDAESVAEAKESGVSGYILKPFSAEQLEAKIRIIMQKRLAA